MFKVNSITVQKLRRPVQVFVFLLIIGIPLFNYYGILIQQKDDFSIGDSWIYSSIHSVFEGDNRNEVIELTHKVKGSVWTIDIFGFKMSDPLAFVESTVITVFLYGPMLLSILIPVVLTIFLGKVYCGWICPMNLLLELNDKLRGLLKKTGYNTRNIRFSTKTKYYVLLFGLIAAFAAGRPLLALIYPPAVISREIFYKIFYGFWGTGLLIIGFILFFELILSRRWWCRYICPGGAVYTVLSRIRILKIKRDDTFCDKCGNCIPICPYDLKPMTKELMADCDQCGLCISVCKPGALEYTLRPRFSNTIELAGSKKNNILMGYKDRFDKKRILVNNYLNGDSEL